MHVSKLALVFGIASLTACSHHDAAATTTTTTETQSASSAPSTESSTAPEGTATSAGPPMAGMRSTCDLVTASEMQGLIGSAVTANETHVEGAKNSTCIYIGGAKQTVLTVEIIDGPTGPTLKMLQETSAASSGKQIAGLKGQTILSVFNETGKTKAIYDFAMSKL